MFTLRFRLAFIFFMLAITSERAFSADPCVDLTGRYRLGTVADTCHFRSRGLSVFPSERFAPPEGGVSLFENYMGAIFIPENSTFEIRQNGCDSLTVSYESRSWDTPDHKMKSSTETKTVTLKQAVGKPHFVISPDSLRGSRGYDAMQAMPIPELDQTEWFWSLSRAKGKLKLSEFDLASGLVLFIPSLDFASFGCTFMEY